MIKGGKRVRNVAIGVVAFLMILAVALIQVVQTGWFRSYVKQKIITATEKSTGGTVEVGSFTFDWRHLDAVLTDLVIRGDEPADASPFLRVGRAEAKLRLLPGLRHVLNLAYLGIDRPEANIVVFPDGHTNVPTPKQPSTSNTTALEEVVDLAVGHFELTNGWLTLNSQKQPVNLHADNLQAQLQYSVMKRGYQGQISFEPLYVISNRNTPVKFALTIPIAVGRDRIDLHDARISTPASQISISASLENLRNPKLTGHIKGRLALIDLKNLGDLPIVLDPAQPLAAADLDLDAMIANDAIDVSGLHTSIGRSSIEASGRLKDPRGSGAMEFKAQLQLEEAGRLAKVTAQPMGTVKLNGTVKLDANNNYQVAGNLEAAGVSFLTEGESGARRIGEFNLNSQVRLDPHRLDLDNLRLVALGAELGGSATLEDFTRYRLKGVLRQLDLETVARSIGVKTSPYAGDAAGTISAQGDLNTPGTKSLTADARITVSPGTPGIPVSGRMFVNYDGAADNVSIRDSYVALPHSRLALSGSLGDRVEVTLTTRDLNDLLAAVPLTGKPPVRLVQGGQATLTAAVSGRFVSPRISGHLAASRFAIADREFDRLALDVSGWSSGASVANGVLSRGTMQTALSGSVRLRDWMVTPQAQISGEIAVHDADLADMIVLGGHTGGEYSGALSATVHVSGTVGNPLGSANLLASHGTIQGEPFDQIQAQLNLTDQLITLTSAQAVSGPARINLTAEFKHPRDSFTTGTLHGRLQTNGVSVTQARALQKRLPNSAGEVQLQAEATGMLTETQGRTEFLLTAVSGDASARGLKFEGQNYGDFTATARTNGQTVHFDIASDFAGSKISVSGGTELTRDYPTKADATIANLSMERVLTLAKRADIPIKGNLSGAAHFTGTIEKPEGNAELDVANAVLYDEPVDHLRADVVYKAQSIDLPHLEVTSGQSHINLAGKYDHTAGDLRTGTLQFRFNGSRLNLAQIHNVQKIRPGLSGSLQMDANGVAAVSPTGAGIQLRNLDANLVLNGLAAQGKNLGDLKLTANTTGGRVNFVLDSNLADASIQGKGNAELNGNYPLNADLAFTNLAWTRVQAMLGPDAGEPSSFEAMADGQATVSGPVSEIEQLRGSLKLTRLNLNTIVPSGARGPIVLQNQDPIVMSLDRGTAKIDSLHLVGPQTDLQAHGTASLRAQTLDLTVNGNSKLAVIQELNRDVVSSGSVVLVANVHGPVKSPVVNGRLELHDASVAYTGFSNGISKANGVIQFNGTTASVQQLTGESGGGKITLAGFVTFRDAIRFGLRANASNVRVRPQEGMSVALDANINLTGTPQASLLSGTVTLDRLTYAPRSDFGALLSRAAPPVDVSRAPSPLFDKMKLEIQARTSPAAAVRTSLAEGLQANADLRIRGTASQPGALGRINITDGQLVFFGSNYTVNTGTIGFYNPVRIEPILNLSLETQTKGVDVVLRVTGPVDNMKLSYTSDPPLQFQEIVELLASGKVPTSDPTLLANQPTEPTQSLAQMGESAVVGRALANPASSQLQRVFGVSQFKIDPTFAGGSELPQARLTLQQRVATNVTFTYVTDVNDPNTQIIRVEWALNSQWSAIGMRDQNGILSVKFAYKKQFR